MDQLDPWKEQCEQCEEEFDPDDLDEAGWCEGCAEYTNNPDFSDEAYERYRQEIVDNSGEDNE